MKVWLPFFLSLFVFAPVGYGVDILTLKMEGFVQEDGLGLYQQIYSEIKSKGEIESSLVIMPRARAIYQFDNNSSTCLLAGEGAVQSKRDKYLFSSPIGWYRVHILTLKSVPMISSFSDIPSEAAIGSLRGMQELTTSIMPKHIAVNYVNDNSQNIEMLRKGRINALIAIFPNLKNFSEELHYNSEFILDEGKDYIICHKSEYGAKFISKINKALEQMSVDGSYDRIIENYNES